MHFVKYFYCKKNLLALAPEQEDFSILAPAPFFGFNHSGSKA